MVERPLLRPLVSFKNLPLLPQNILYTFVHADEADTSSTHDFYKKLPDVDIENEEEVGMCVCVYIQSGFAKI